MAILNNKPFINTGLFDDINKTNNQISSMNFPQIPQTPQTNPMEKRQRYGSMMLALSDVLKGRDPTPGVLQRQAFLKQQQMQSERDKLNQELNAAIDNSNIPETQKTFIKAMGIKEKYDALYGQKAPKREYTEDVRGVKRYIDTQERVFPGIQIPEDKTNNTEFERNIKEYNRLKSIPTDQLTETDKRNIDIYENKLLKTTAPKIYQVVGPNNERAGLATYDEFTQGQAAGIYPKGSTIVNIPTGTEAPKAPKPEVFSVENKPFADKWQATSNLQQNLQNYTNELQKMDEAALTGVGAGAKFATSLIQNTKGFLNLASADTKSFYNDAVAKNSYTTLEGTDFTARLKNVSNQFGVNESQVRDLAYLFAAARGQEGRGLSDKDYENALQIVSGGVGKEGKIAVIESVYNRLGGEISNAVDGRIRTLQYLKENSPESEASYFDRQITQLNALKEATPFNPYINPLKQEDLLPDPFGLRKGT